MLQVPRDEHMAQRQRADGVGRHGGVAETDHQRAVDRLVQKRLQLLAQRLRGIGECRLRLHAQRCQVQCQIPPLRFAQRVCGGIVRDLHGVNGAAAARAFPGAQAGQ